MRAANAGGIGHQDDAFGGEQSLGLQGKFEDGMAIDLHGDALAPGRALAPEQALPIVAIPQRKQLRIAAQDDGAALVEMGHRTLRAGALAMANLGNAGTLRNIECVLDARIAQPGQRIQQVMPVLLTGGEAALGDALLVVQAIGEQRRRLRDKTRPRDAIRGLHASTQLLKLAQARPCPGHAEDAQLRSPIGQRRLREDFAIDQIHGGDDKAQAWHGQWRRWHASVPLALRTRSISCRRMIAAGACAVPAGSCSKAWLAGTGIERNPSLAQNGLAFANGVQYGDWRG